MDQRGPPIRKRQNLQTETPDPWLRGPPSGDSFSTSSTSTHVPLRKLPMHAPWLSPSPLVMISKRVGESARSESSGKCVGKRHLPRDGGRASPYDGGLSPSLHPATCVHMSPLDPDAIPDAVRFGSCRHDAYPQNSRTARLHSITIPSQFILQGMSVACLDLLSYA